MYTELSANEALELATKLTAAANRVAASQMRGAYEYVHFNGERYRVGSPEPIVVLRYNREELADGSVNYTPVEEDSTDA